MQRRTYALGKSKIFYSTGKHNLLIMKFVDWVHGGGREEKIPQTGKFRADITEIFFKVLDLKGIKTHLRERVSETEFYVGKLEMFKVEIVPRNFAAGTLIKNYPFNLGDKINPPLINFYLKSGNDPLLNQGMILALNLMNRTQYREIYLLAKKINSVLSQFLKSKKITLADFKFECGLNSKNEIVVGDEISSDCARMWDMETHGSYDKDIFRYQKGDVLETYKKLLERIKK